MQESQLISTPLPEIVQRLVSALHPERVYLFGSRARADAKPESDNDVLIVGSHATDQPYALERQAYRALVGLSTPVDVMVISRDRFEQRRHVRASLVATVEREGRLLYAA